MPGVIVVGVDGNARSARAARVAADLAVATSQALHVVCAYSRDQAAEVEGPGGERVISISEESAGIARRVADELASTHLVPVSSAAANARPADALLREAERLGASLIVVGNRRMQGIARVLGSVPASVAHNASCDVYIVNTA